MIPKRYNMSLKM